MALAKGSPFARMGGPDCEREFDEGCWKPKLVCGGGDARRPGKKTCCPTFRPVGSEIWGFTCCRLSLSMPSLLAISEKLVSPNCTIATGLLSDTGSKSKAGAGPMELPTLGGGIEFLFSI